MDILSFFWLACKEYCTASLTDTDLLYLSATHNLTLATRCLRQLSVPSPLQTNLIWPWEKAIVGVSRRAPSQGAPRGHRGTAAKLWLGILPSVEKISAVQWLAVQLTWATRPRVSGELPANSCIPAVRAVSEIPSCALSGLFKPCCQPRR